MPTDETTTARANLSEAKRALLEQRLAGKASAGARPSLIPRSTETGEPVELSFSQELVYEAARAEGSPSFYNIVVSFAGSLDTAALGRALNALVERHAVLRTTFVEDGGRAFQVVHPARPFALPATDLSELPPAEREERARRMCVEQVVAPFDLARGALFRASLLRMSEAEHRLLCAIAHIACDHWSLGLLTGELAALYEAFANGSPTPLAPLPMQYADFARWQRRRFAGGATENLLDYWTRQLADAPPPLRLPQSRPLPPRPTFNGAHESLLMPERLTPLLDAVGRRASATRFMTLLAAFYALLHHYTGRSDFVVASASAGRPRVELEGLIGCFINLLALRAKLSAGMSFLELVGVVRGVTLDAFAHQEMPFGRVVEALGAAHARGLEQICFMLHNDTGERLKVPGLSISSHMIDTGRSATDLTLSVQPTPRGLLATFEHNTDLFAREAVATMLRDFQMLLTSVAERPEQTLREASSAVVAVDLAQ